MGRFLRRRFPSGEADDELTAETPSTVQAMGRFHIMQLFERAVDRVRCAEPKSSAEGRRLLMPELRDGRGGARPRPRLGHALERPPR